MKDVCQTNADGVFIGLTVADESPLEPGVFLLPAGAIDTEVPNIPEGSRARWIGEWLIESVQPAPPPSPAEILAQYSAAIQSRLDEFARTRNYDSILSACTYATSAVPQFAAEGQYAVAARDATWAQGYAILQAVQAEERPAPTLDELFAELPALTWP